MDPDGAEQSGPSKSSADKLNDLHESHTKIIDLHHDALSRLNKIEQRVDKLEGSDSDDSSDAASDFDDDYILGYEENVIPEVRDVDYEHFKNRYSEQDGKYCIEALVAGSDIGDQIWSELKRRDLLTSRDMKESDDYDESDESLLYRVRIQSPSVLFLLHNVLQNQQGNGSFIWKGQNRITFFRPFNWFIYTQEKMKLKLEELEQKFALESSSHEINKTQTIAELVTCLEQTVIPDGGEAFKPTQTVNPKESPPLHKRTERHILEKALLESYQTLLALRCYVDFVDSRIIPEAARHNKENSLDNTLVRWRDIAYWFRVGELVYVDQTVIPTGDMNTTLVGPRIARVRRIVKPSSTASAVWNRSNPDICVPKRKESGAGIQYWIYCYVIDYNGENFIPVDCPISIHFFSGSRDITSLPVFPLRFHSDNQRLIDTAQHSGLNFLEAVSSKHMLYRGWTALPPPRFPPPKPGRGGPPPPMQHGMDPRFVSNVMDQGIRGVPMGRIPENDEFSARQAVNKETAIDKINYIESEAIVDFKEAIRSAPGWGIAANIPLASKWLPQHWIVLEDTVDLIRWVDRHRRHKISTIQDRIQACDDISELESSDYHNHEKFMKPQPNHDFTVEDRTLLPTRLYAYALRERKFFVGNVDSFHKLATGEDPFENLKIDKGHIRIVQSVVWSHFQRKLMELSELPSQMDQDLIRGKGRGVVILLHGAPGVGKTATAEAVALWHRKPLFAITCGDLGFTPQGVESSLGEIFRLAHLWDCILLLDEADVFLSQRETNTLQRNALVSVFLRVLEYYNGLLFLTTNRVGTLDEAFKSRVHLSLYYPALDRSQTTDIMLMNLNRLDAIEEQRTRPTSQKKLFIRKEKICLFAGKHWDRHSTNDGEGRWNGRQIRNAVQIAASLALYDNHTDKDQGSEQLPPVLDESHFQLVEETMTLFEGYMSKTRGGNAAFIAQQRSERDDRFKVPQPGLSQARQYEPYPSGSRGPGEYVPYAAQAQYSGIPQSFPMAQQYYPQFSQANPAYVPKEMSASFLTAESAGYGHTQADVYRSATHQQMPSGAATSQSGLSHSGQTSSYTSTFPLPPGMSFQPQNPLGQSSASQEGYDPSK